ncbi:MAG: hypothetical protein JSR15_05580, partial [Proteobacteria bacterium]|nr:hypothetical protein [Pseudomonadota bacterium]
MHITRLRHPLAGSRLLAAALAASLAVNLTAVPFSAAADQPAHPPEASIPFAAHDGIDNWEADGNKGLWIKARGNHWYYARFFAPCNGLQFHEGLRFKFGPSGELDRFGEVYTRDTGRCAFTSLVASDGP